MNSAYIRNLYSPGFSFITLSFYKTNLSVRFTPWINQNQTGRSQYDAKKFIVTTISDESAASLYYLAQKIAEGELNNPVQYVIECNNQITLVFEYDADKATLSIEKDREKIVFEFAVHQYRVKEDGRIVTKTIQSGLLAFAEVLQAYLTAVGADRQQEIQTGTEFVGSQMPMASSGWR